MKNLILIDRDGTLIYDKKYHLGRTKGWKSKVKILPKVIEGLKLLNTLSDTAIYMITNQPGVAIKSFPLLTLEKAHKVSKYVVNKLKKEGGKLKGYFLCPHASLNYAYKKDDKEFDDKLVCDCQCIKPRLGMVFDALKNEGIRIDDVNIFVIGDRASDVQTALNVNGIGILTPFENEPNEKEKVENFKDKLNVYIAKDFLDASEFILNKVKSIKI